MKPVRFLTVFLSLLVLGWLGCVTGPTPKDIKQAEISYDLGVGDLREGRVTEALKNFLDSVKLNPDFAEAHNGLGLTHYMLGNHEKATAHFQKSLELKPDRAEVMNNLARVYISQNRYRLAIPLLRKALQDVFLKERYLAESNLGWSLFQIGEVEEGFKCVRNALALNERFCVGYEYLGLMHQSRKEYSEAIREFSELTEKCPRYITGWLNLGKAHLMQGDDANGCNALEKCRSISRMTDVGRECQRLYETGCSGSPTPAGKSSGSP